MINRNDPELDNMLNAFVDGELDPQTENEIRAFLETDEDAQRRVEAYRKQRETLHLLFDQVLDEPLTTEIQETLYTPARKTQFWDMPVWRMAAAITLFIFGGATGWWSHGAATNVQTVDAQTSVAYVDRALGAHVVYSAEVRHPVEVGADEEQHLITWLSKRLGRSVHAPDLDQVGYQLIGGRLLADQSKPAAQFMYENRNGQRLTMYVSLTADKEQSAFRIKEQDNTSAVYWFEDGLGYALAGDLPRTDMLKIAQLVYDALFI